MIDLLKNFDKFVVIERETKTKQLRFYNSKIGIIKEWKNKKMELFLYKKGKLISFSVENPDRNKVKKGIERAEKIMGHIPPMSFELGERRKYINNKYFDKNILNDESLLKEAEKAIEKSLEYGEESAGVLYSTKENLKIENSNGVCCEDMNSMAYLSIRTLFKNQSFHSVNCSRRLDNIGKKIFFDEFLKTPEKKKFIKEGRYDVLFTPMAFANLISYFANFSSAFAVDSGYSFLENKIGTKVASECMTIYDSGIEKDGIFSRKFDDEGISTQKTTIVENGELKTYLHNSTTALKHDCETTGNAGIISPVPWNTVVDGGDYKINEMIEDLSNALLITNVWYTRFHNYRTGDFSTVARDIAFHIKNGEISEIVKGIRISDNMERILKNVTFLSKEKRQIYWWEVENPVFAPYAVVRNVSITTTNR
ncbi:MAG TPA: TldD/PmbA family protein [Thermoplasmatales archaeon]|nr:TldD/PmbA family protein [Thermoplasmatales archaeon]